VNEYTPSWLNLRGTDRAAAVERASQELLRTYREQWPQLIPPELHRLAASLGCRILTVNGLQGGARLLPVKGGFHVLVSDRLESGRYRTSVAHELCHTLFYSRDGDIPKRFLPSSDAEEHFCFDVARRVLAPKWMVETVGLLHQCDAESVFRTLTEKFKLSRPAAARLMLADYRLAVGVAGRWSLVEGEWVLNRGESFASPKLTTGEKKVLHSTARNWLGDKYRESMFRRVFGFRETENQSAFVFVQIGLPKPATG
jgi:hypothetical protein